MYKTLDIFSTVALAQSLYIYIVAQKMCKLGIHRLVNAGCILGIAWALYRVCHVV